MSRTPTPTQLAALKALSAAPLVRTSAGWHHDGDAAHAYQTQTIISLENERCLKISLQANRPYHFIARITEPGRWLIGYALRKSIRRQTGG
jgi:hypothetical protein